MLDQEKIEDLLVLASKEVKNYFQKKKYEHLVKLQKNYKKKKKKNKGSLKLLFKLKDKA